MAKYNDSDLADRVRAVLYANSTGAIDAVELRDLLLDFVDSKLSADASIGLPETGTILDSDLTGGAYDLTHTLDTEFPYVIIKSWTGDILGEAHFTQTPVGSDTVHLVFEEDFPAGSGVDYIIVKF